MTEESLNPIVYSKNVIEFVTVANEFCNLVEHVGQETTRSFLNKTQKILPLLYLKVSVLEDVNSYEELGLEKFVSEVDYNYLQQKMMNLLGEFDDFQEVFDPGMQFSDEPLSASISECLADIYQDLKDFLMTFRTGDELVMQEALWVCQDNFKNYWGQRLVNSLRAVHNLMYGDYDLDQAMNQASKSEDIEAESNKPEWLNQLFKDQGE
ncbi:DUF5063 domain-containing protein [Sunxiuqinia elliptica]|uniref:Uncharacterized protein DUF5063 n=1 Tax=Sunxiuqinia elliptica TaxID=655355 RepID=A0A4R6GYE4_9BACT|nr:DUF5063 domain-containing protein [Sunxiuqinia elliptica]TDN99875.1 uncharacterized protein DUF5063 [Sunxiuqinia elliptica]TDO57067.1 uncharacterized protein DUF5063 [Sunxiuqinia elliptica]